MRLTLIAIAAGALIGAMAGVGGYTFIYAKSASYRAHTAAYHSSL